MVPSQFVISSVKKLISPLVPAAQVVLFGSRAAGTATNESDWDILILTQQPVNHSLKKKIFEKVFPLSVQIASFINLLIVQEQDWLNNPAYYALQQSIKGSKQLA